MYDSNSSIKTYVDSYKTYLEGQGVTIKEARLLKIQEAYALGCGNGQPVCHNAPAWVYETSYWLGSPHNFDFIWYVRFDTIFSDYGVYADDSTFGVRPVIVI